MATYNNYLVSWVPGWHSTINDMKIIDAFSTTGGIEQANRWVEDNLPMYREKHGEGRIGVHKTNKKSFYS